MPSPRDYVSLRDSEVRHVAGARAVGRVNPHEVAEVTLYVRGAAPEESLDSFLNDLGQQPIAERAHLSREEFAANHGADPSDLAKVAAFANKNNLSIVGISPAKRTVRVRGTLDSLAKAFNVQFSIYHSHQGSYRAYTGSVHVPHEISDLVKGVFGLDTKPQSTFHLRQFRAMPHTYARGARAAPAQGYTPIDVASLYSFPAGVYGQGRCVGIIEFGGGYRMDDLNTYFQMLGVATPEIVAVSVGGATNAPTGNPNGPDAEVMLDIEVVGAIVPGAQLVVYFAPNTTLGWLSGIGTAIHDGFHQPSVISISWGGPENSWSPRAMDALNWQFKAAGAMGITICTAAGDNGYTDGVPGRQAHVDFPASSPYVLACGGTRLESSGGNISAETVWYDSPDSATGGGVSDFFALPSYQAEANVPKSVNANCQSAGRGVPDVAGDADPVTGYRVRVDGADLVIGGTSAVAPLWAGLLTQIEQELDNSLGFINPLLYSLDPAAGAFNDIVNGNNGKGGYEAGPGWDACTGLGSPNGTTLSGLL